MVLDIFMKETTIICEHYIGSEGCALGYIKWGM